MKLTPEQLRDLRQFALDTYSNESNQYARVCHLLDRFQAAHEGPQYLEWFALMATRDGRNCSMHHIGRFADGDRAALHAARQLPGQLVITLDETDARAWMAVFNITLKAD